MSFHPFFAAILTRLHQGQVLCDVLPPIPWSYSNSVASETGSV